MNNFKIKVLFSVLGAILFSFIIILLAFTLPVHQKTQFIPNYPTGELQHVSQILKKRLGQ